MLGISPTHRFHLQYLTQLHTKPSIMKTHPQRQKKELLHLKKAIGIESSCNAGILITNTSNNAPKPHQVFEVLPMTYRKLVYDSNPSNMQASREKIVIRIGFYTESARRERERGGTFHDHRVGKGKSDGNRESLWKKKAKKLKQTNCAN